MSIKTKFCALLTLGLSFNALAEPYFGEFTAEMPGAKALKSATEADKKMMALYQMTAQRMAITANNILFKTGPLSEQTLTYTVQGDILLGRTVRFEGEVFFTPIYVANKDTLFANGFKFVRTK